jgi:curved DNA-binding protein CbpA
MSENHTLLGLLPGATPAEVKAAYHGKLKEFPAHKYPQEFKAIRSAYEALQKESQQTNEDFFEIGPATVKLNQQALQDLRSRVASKTAVSLEELIVLTF